MVKDKSSLAVFKDYNPSEDLRKPPGKAGTATPAAPTPVAAPPSAPAPAAAPAAVAPPPPPPPTASPAPTTSTPRSSSAERIFASPLAKKLASEKGIDLSLIQGTGPDNQIRSKDVLNYVPKPAAGTKVEAAPVVSTPQPPKQQQVSTPGQFADLALNNFRSVTAKRLTLSKQTIPHYYLTCELELDNALK
jgi:pyruvate dehydrogenase E2 component (dihydrolipoamide acetyltransferase)